MIQKIVQQLFQPVSFSSFLSDFLEKKPIFARGQSRERFAGVLSLSVIDQAIAAGYLRHPRIRLVKGGQEIPPTRYVVGDNLIDADALFAEHAAGATIVINSLHLHWRPLSQLCGELARLLSVPVQANIYLTPRFSQGFDVHYDLHDVLVLQIAGEKNWRLYGSPRTLPGRNEPHHRPDKEKLRVRQRCTLKSGDCLYIPRGHLHDATASVEPSLHITVGLLTATWGDVLTEAAKMLIEGQTPLRRSLPAGYANRRGSHPDLRHHIEALRSTIASRLPLEKALEVVATRFISQQPQFLEDHLLDLQSPWLVQTDTILVRRSGIFFREVREGGRIGLQFYRKKVLMPRFVAPALKHLTRVEGEFRPADVPGDLTEDSKVLLCRRLMTEGFLKRVAGAQPSSA